jgi:hypothetical protein
MKIKSVSRFLLVWSFCCYATCVWSTSNVKVKIQPIAGADLYGYICDMHNQPVVGVVVSDGYHCVSSNAKGIYQMKRNAKAQFVFYSIPEGYKVNTHSFKDKTAMFYAPLSKEVKRYDFQLAKLPGGVEKNFTLIAIGDPQVSIHPNDPYYTKTGEKFTSKDYPNIWRFKNETLKDIEQTLKTISTPVYGITMGDDVDAGAYSLQDSMRAALGSTPMTVFSVVGNHDKNGNTTAYDTIGVAAFQKAWGPRNYSFNRGNVHIVALDDIVFTNPSNLKEYRAGFSDEQVEWLKQDLSFVPKSKMVILCYHIPLRNTESIHNRTAVLSLLKGFHNTALFCGHTHWHEVCDVKSPIQTIEHIHAAACGSWWKSTLNTEGTPNGYEVYTIAGPQFKEYYYKAVCHDRNYQMRVSEADLNFGGEHGYYNYADELSLPKNAGYIVADVFNANSHWSIKAYEGSSTAGVDMTKGSTTEDAYAMGCHVGIIGRVASHYTAPNKHLFYYKRKNLNLPVRVEAIDEFGHKYVSTSFVTNLDGALHY